jgi:hypothetical protein
MKQIHVLPTRVEGSFMLTVTEAAGEHLAQVLADTQEDVAIRFVLAGQTLDMQETQEGPRLTLS